MSTLSPLHLDDDDDGDTASQRSISLSSPADSLRNSLSRQTPISPHEFSFEDGDDHGLYDHGTADYANDTAVTSAAPDSAAPSEYSVKSPPAPDSPAATYPPAPLAFTDRGSVASFATSSSYSKKVRPESMLLTLPNGPLILGIALVDFNHIVGPKIEFSRGDLFQDEEINKILPFLALPDGAHLASEDYTYFHLVPSVLKATTVFGISCNRQIASSALTVKAADVTRSTVQKAVVILASKPVFGPIRDRLGVVTLALFEQRDFSDLHILDDFHSSLEVSLKSQFTESGLYMGTSLRELVHTFRQRTLLLLKALMLQKRIMFYGHPVERLCTYQYSLVSLVPGLLHNLEDCGSPPLASRAPSLTRPTSLKTSDHKSMMAYLGLPLDLFGKDAFFQPYLPLQQLDMIKESKSSLCGSTNSIVTDQKEIDLLVNVETGTMEFRDLKLERSAGLTAADRKWMDDIVRDVNEGWSDDEPRSAVQFKGSDDYLRQKFEEYISGALASVKYADFLTKGQGGVVITDGSGGDSNSIQDFNPIWISEFKRTNAYEVWDRITDPLIFDIVEPRHPCAGKPSVVEDIGLRLQEGIQDLKLEQQLAPTREALSKTFQSGSTNFFKAVDGVRGRFLQRTSSSAPSTADSSRASTPPVEVSKLEVEQHMVESPVSLPNTPKVAETASAAIGSWSSGIGSFFSSKASRFSLGAGSVTPGGESTSTTVVGTSSVTSSPRASLASSSSPRASLVSSTSPRASLTSNLNKLVGRPEPESEPELENGHAHIIEEEHGSMGVAM